MRLVTKLLSILAVSVCMISATGCGGPADTKIAVQTSAIEANVKKTLEEYAKTGKCGSSLTSLGSDINGIASTDSTKAANLKKGYAQLQQVVNEPAKVKTAAKEMLGML